MFNGSGMSWLRASGACGTSSQCIRMIAMESATNGVSPVSSSYRMQPIEYRSALGSPAHVPSHRSGAM